MGGRVRLALWNLVMRSIALWKIISTKVRRKTVAYVRVKDVVCDPRIGRAQVNDGCAVGRRDAHDYHVACDLGTSVGGQDLAAFHE